MVADTAFSPYGAGAHRCWPPFSTRLQWLGASTGGSLPCRWPETISPPCTRPSRARPRQLQRLAHAGPAQRFNWNRSPWKTSACASCWPCASAPALSATGAQVLYDAADPYSRKIVIDRGQTHGIQAGSPVIDESGVHRPGDARLPAGLGSHAADRPRPGHSGAERAHRRAQRGLWRTLRQWRCAWSCATRWPAPTSTDGDLLTTSGVDGVYPAGPARGSRDAGGAPAPSRRSQRVRVRTAWLGCRAALHVLVLAPAW